MEYFIGIDGGGSKTKSVLCNSNLDIISQTSSGPSNFLTIGTDIVSETIVDLIEECCNNSNINPSQITNIVLGTTGAGRESDASRLKESVLIKANESNLVLNSFNVVSDARIALEGAFSGKPGSILIAGTGSILFGKDREGNIHRVGGFGRLIGDEGSGFTLGKRGLNLLAKYYDGRISDTLLKDKIEHQFSIKNQEELIIKVYSESIKIQDIAPLVINAASEGDKLCFEILDEESTHLLVQIMSMQKKLNDDKMKIVFIGGTISNENAYSQILKEKIKSFLPSIIIQQPDSSPEMGAVIMAKEEKNHE